MSDSATAPCAALARPDGSRQVTYDGKPLYYHKGDQGPGDRKGAGTKASGGEASLVRPDGTRASRGGR